MPLSLDQVRHIAGLARIELSEAELALVSEQLNNIFGLIGELQAADTRGTEPMAHAGESAVRLREDKVLEADQRSLYQSIAPQVEQGLYLVPKVIE